MRVKFVKIEDTRLGSIYINVDLIEAMKFVNEMDGTGKWSVVVGNIVYVLNELPDVLKGMMEHDK